MMDFDNIPDTQTEAEELEEVVMGLIINSWTSAQPGVCGTEQANRAILLQQKP
ncbi:hypothetical protein ACNKHX_09095 [Shigella flexneri]